MSALAQKRMASPASSPNQFVVTVLDGQKNVLWSTIWGGHGALGVGYPFEWVLERRQSTIRLRRIGMVPDRVLANPTQEFDFETLEGTPIPLSTESPAFGASGPLWLDVAPVRSLGDLRTQIAETGWVPTALPDSSIDENQTDPLFNRTATVFTSLLIAAWFATLFIPVAKKNEDELIPPQFAKTLLSPLSKEKSGSSPSAAGRTGGGHNLVMAFKSEVVKKTTKALLNAGATKALLNTSSLLDGAATSNLVRKVFDGKGPRVGQGKGIDPKALLPSDSTQIGFLGGKGKGKGGGSADYGTGRGAAVAGQGNSQLGISPEGAGVSEGLTKDEVGLVIRKHLDEVRYCYESALVRSPGFEGKLVASFTIKNTGWVKVATTKESSADIKLDRCILDRLLTWEFPKPRGGVDVGVSYPFIFKSLGN